MKLYEGRTQCICKDIQAAVYFEGNVLEPRRRWTGTCRQCCLNRGSETSVLYGSNTHSSNSQCENCNNPPVDAIVRNMFPKAEEEDQEVQLYGPKSQIEHKKHCEGSMQVLLQAMDEGRV